MEQKTAEDSCKDMDELYDSLDSLLNRLTGSGDYLEKVSICPLYDPCRDHSPIAGYLLFEKLTQKKQKNARKELLRYARGSKRAFISVKPRFCKGETNCFGHYGRFYFEGDSVHCEDPANILLNRLPKNLNSVYVYFFKRSL